MAGCRLRAGQPSSILRPTTLNTPMTTAASNGSLKAATSVMEEEIVSAGLLQTPWAQ